MTAAGYKKLVIAGRVPVKVNNENGQIEVGDYVTSSSTAGQAMKATEEGRVIGIALENLSGESGEIDLLLNMFYWNPNFETDIQGSSTLTVNNIHTPVGKDLIIEPDSGKTQIIGELTVTEGVVFNGDIQILGHIIGNSDTRGTLTIPAGETEAEYVFESAYSQIPVVVISPKQNTYVNYWTEKYINKFIIKIESPLTTDVKFDWIIQE